ncbi:MAG: DNA repair protein RadC [Cytophagales bacterium]|nr:DNA repair protein RadC [Cytophagales bacterium]
MDKKLTIKHLAEEDRPREKLLLKGKNTLSDAELIGILLGSGNKEQNAVGLAQSILGTVNNDLHNLAKLSVKDLEKFNGIGEAKAINIISALELGRRRKNKEKVEQPQIKCSNDAYEVLSPYLMDLQHEEFWILCLNRANKVMKVHCISSGGVSGTVADPKLIFKIALEQTASGLILAHNHPSGNLQASQADINLTQKVKEAGKVLEIPILDHLILTNDDYFSFADNGLM